VPITPEAAAKPAGETQEVVLAKWLELAKSATREKPNIDEGLMLAEKLAQFGPDALMPMVDVLADAASTPYAKALASMGLSYQADAKLLPKLLPLVKPEKDLAMRICAAGVLANVPGAQAEAALNELKADKERQVRFHALRGLATRSAAGRKALADLWKQPDTTPAERNQIVMVLSSGTASDSQPLFQEAMRDTTLPEETRLFAIQILGRVGAPAFAPSLNECAEKDPNEKIRAAAKTAAEAIQARENKKGTLQ